MSNKITNNDKNTTKAVILGQEPSTSPSPKAGAKSYAHISRAPSDSELRADLGNANSLDIPENVTKAFATLGWNLRWVRVVDPKTKQGSNERINYFKGLGGELVSPAMLQEIGARDFLRNLTQYEYRESFAEGGDDDRQGREQRESGLAVRKDSLVLMMIPHAVRVRRQKQNQEDMRQRLATTQRNYKENTGGAVSMQFSSNFVNKPTDLFAE